jgi:hypothetical protein
VKPKRPAPPAMDRSPLATAWDRIWARLGEAFTGAQAFAKPEPAPLRACEHCFAHECLKHPAKNVCCRCGRHASESDDLAQLDAYHEPDAWPLRFSCGNQRNPREAFEEMAARTRAAGGYPTRR